MGDESAAGPFFSLSCVIDWAGKVGSKVGNAQGKGNGGPKHRNQYRIQISMIHSPTPKNVPWMQFRHKLHSKEESGKWRRLSATRISKVWMRVILVFLFLYILESSKSAVRLNSCINILNKHAHPTNKERRDWIPAPPSHYTVIAHLKWLRGKLQRNPHTGKITQFGKSNSLRKALFSILDSTWLWALVRYIHPP